MATGTAGDFATHYASNQIHYLSKKITFASEDVAVVVGELPPYASVVSGGVHIVTAFNDSGTDLLDVGLASTYGVTENTDAFATDLDLSAVGFIALDELGATTNIMQTTPVLWRPILVRTTTHRLVWLMWLSASWFTATLADQTNPVDGG
jgi:hypothetical protein